MDADKLQRLVTTEMPFGKHKGTLLADLPGNYLNWFAREGFPKGELGQLLALMHEIDHNGLSDLLKPLRGGAQLEPLTGGRAGDLPNSPPILAQGPRPLGRGSVRLSALVLAFAAVQAGVVDRNQLRDGENIRARMVDPGK